MKALVYTAPNEVQLIDRSYPDLAEGEAIATVVKTGTVAENVPSPGIIGSPPSVPSMIEWRSPCRP
ncbi:MAG: hypothetical protein FJW24_01275 [Acidimicrobiia bacterium]|nr:hypothetical protein [Acidimicrobiia bacterium]